MKQKSIIIPGLFIVMIILSFRTPILKADNITTSVAPAESLVTLTNITSVLCPITLKQGDREFGGAPTVNIKVNLEISSSGSGLIAVINFSAMERGGDATWVKDVFRRTVYTAPAGYRISSINPANLSSSVVNFVGTDAGAEFGICNEGQHATATPGGLVKQIIWIGDTGGNDVAASRTDCRCDTKIKEIIFNKVRITTSKI